MVKTLFLFMVTVDLVGFATIRRIGWRQKAGQIVCVISFGQKRIGAALLDQLAVGYFGIQFFPFVGDLEPCAAVQGLRQNVPGVFVVV